MRLPPMLDSEYRAIPCESFSSLSHLVKSPQDFLDNKKKKFKPNRSLIFGTCTHHYIQGNRHLVHLSQSEEADQLFILHNPDGIIIPEEWSESFKEGLEVIAEKVANNPSMQYYLKQGEYEVGFKGKFGHLDIKGKLDVYNPKFILDIKTTASGTSPEIVESSIDKWNYDMQAYTYLMLSEAEHRDYYFIFALSRHPYTTVIYKAKQSTIESGKAKFKLALDAHLKYIVNQELWLPPILEV